MNHTRTATVRVVGNHLLYLSDFHPELVRLLKLRIPATDRAWDKATRGWLITAAHLDALQQITEAVLGQQARVIGAPPPPTAAVRTAVFKVEYIGAVKQRPDGQRTATGYADGQWRVIFPEKVLLDWFGLIERPDQKSTLYQVLGVKPTATADELKKAWRRLALQWHPDRCKEPDAHTQFLAIKDAWAVLGDTATRRRYDAGLALEASLATADPNIAVQVSTGFRPPLRCGWILAQVEDKLLGRCEVHRIIAWEDIMEHQGRIMVPSWPAGADTFTVDWVQP